MDRFLRIQEGSTYWSISDVPKMASLEFIASGNASEDDGNMVWGISRNSPVDPDLYWTYYDGEENAAWISSDVGQQKTHKGRISVKCCPQPLDKEYCEKYKERCFDMERKMDMLTCRN